VRDCVEVGLRGECVLRSPSMIHTVKQAAGEVALGKEWGRLAGQGWQKPVGPRREAGRLLARVGGARDFGGVER